MRLQGKTALVTGSSGGIGHGIAVRLAREGASVAVNYRSNAQGADETMAALRPLLASGAKAILVQADTGSTTDGERLCASACSSSAAWTSSSTTPASSAGLRSGRSPRRTTTKS